jgi:hypothetical protein
MSEAPCLTALCGQATGLPGNNVAAGREPGGPDIGYKLVEEVRGLRSVVKECLKADLL